VYAPPRGGETRYEPVRSRERTTQAAMEPTPTMATALREVRGPTVASQRKLANGIAGTRKRSSNTLSFHLIH
jgi:hypothetical protein